MKRLLKNFAISRRKALGSLAVLSVAALTPGVLTAAAWAGSTALEFGLRAQDLLAAGDAPRAVGTLEKALSLSPEDPWLQGLLGRARLGAGDRRGALAAFRRAVSLDPGDSYSRMMAERITQTPLPPVVAQRIRSPSALDRRAAQERSEAVSRAQAAGQDSGRFTLRRVMLDPGHGGFDPGAVGLGGLMEKDVTLDLALRTESILASTAPGLKVYLTRREDYYLPLSARTAEANRFSADVFVSLHINAGERRGANGVETYSCSEKASSREAERLAAFENSVLKLDNGKQARPGFLDMEELLFRFERRRYWDAGARAARRVQTVLAGMLPMPDRGVQSADFYVLRKARMPSLLLETGFVSNPQEEAALKRAEHRERVALALAAAVAGLYREGV